MKRNITTIFLVAVSYLVNAQIKILFDASKAQTAGNADWVIDEDTHNLGWNPGASPGSGNEGNAQHIPTPLQSGISAGTAETYWSGSLSSWGVALVKLGYQVETLPYNGQITYGNSSNTNDLANYKVFITDEPNILFTAAEKTALINFVNNGGGLFIISDHDVSDRNGDGQDSPHILNDLMGNNGIINNPFGITFDYQNYSETTANFANLPGDSILHGPQGNPSQMKISNGTTMTLSTSANPSVAGLVYKTGATVNGTTEVFMCRARYGNGKVVALGDSSPPDDGTGDPNDNLYTGWAGEVNGDHSRIIMNATIWLANNETTTATNFSNEELLPEIFPNPARDKISISNLPAEGLFSLIIYDFNGKKCHSSVLSKKDNIVLLNNLSAGMYYCEIINEEKIISRNKMIIGE